MDEDGSGSYRRISVRNRKVAAKMSAALASSDNRMQAALARLEALENDYGGVETMEIDDDEDASLDEDDQGYGQRKQKGARRRTRQARALENAKKAPKYFLDMLHEANLEALAPNIPSYLTAAVGPPNSSSRRHFCSVCGIAGFMLGHVEVSPWKFPFGRHVPMVPFNCFPWATYVVADVILGYSPFNL
ncbi:unnamed protein product [Victoria cruziana]